jgi:hypothetical protein
MKVKFSLSWFSIACGALLFAQGAVAQTNVQLFSEVNVRNSTATNFLNLDEFNTTTVNLTCNTSPIVATLSGPKMNSAGTAPDLDASNNLQAGGNLLVDNVLLATVTPSSTNVAGPTTNVCIGGTFGTYFGGADIPSSPVDLRESCFTSGYSSVANSIIGANPDTAIVPNGTKTVDAAGGVAPIDISALLSSGKQNLEVDMGDGGGILVGSSLFLSTNCDFGGVTGPATVSGNPITNTDSTSQAQTFNFNTGNNQKVGFVYDVSKVTDPGNGTIPHTKDQPLAESVFQSNYVPGTSFATSSCLIHDGELLDDGVTHACKLFTLECTNPADGTTAGANCPVSTVENEVVKDLFDGPQFSLRNIFTPYGIFHEGIGFLMASDNWTPTSGGPCAFDSNADPVANLPCPQNLLVSFSGPGAFSGKGLTTNPNSTFISIAGVPEVSTSIFVPGEWPDHWSNTNTPKVYFLSQAPNFSKGAYVLNSANKLVPLASAANYIPAPIKSITYGISPVGSTLPVPADQPIANDNTLTPATPCTTTLPTTKTEPNFAPPPFNLPSLPDGQYLLHYYAQDCAGTQELQFTLNPPNAENENLPYWSTNFYTREINIDTLAPVIATLTLPIGGPYPKGSTVYASYECTDATTGSGVVLCGTHVYGTETTYDTGSTPRLTTRIDTSSKGTKTFTVYAVDGAGNKSSRSITYSVK